MNRNSCQTVIQVKDYFLVIPLFWKLQLLPIYVGKVHLWKKFGLERITQNCLSCFFLPNCTQKQHLSGCCCLTCLLKYKSLRLFMYLVWKLNLVSLITALHSNDEWYSARLLCWCVCIWPVDVTAPAINTHYHWQCEVHWLVSYFRNTYTLLNFLSSGPIIRTPKQILFTQIFTVF